MRRFSQLWILPAAGLSLVGCASAPEERGGAVPPQPQGKLIVTPQLDGVGSIALVNDSARYVVVSLALGQTASPGQLLGVYRKGLKVGEIRITGPQDGSLTAADILVGAIQNGDVVLRSQ